MMKRFVVRMFVITLGLGFAFIGISRAQDQYAVDNYGAPQSSPASVNSAVDSRLQELSGKLDSIGAKQDQILKRLDEVRQELDVVKVRASLKG